MEITGKTWGEAWSKFRKKLEIWKQVNVIPLNVNLPCSFISKSTITCKNVGNNVQVKKKL